MLTYVGGQKDLNQSHLSKLSLYSPACSGDAGTPLDFTVPSQVPKLVEDTSLLLTVDNYMVEFSLLVSRISEIIQNLCGTKLASIKHGLAVVTVHKISSQSLFSDAELTFIKQSKGIYEIMEICRKHLSWRNYSLLKLIVKKSGSEEAKHELNKFQRVVSVRQKVKNLENNWLQDPKNYAEGFENMMVFLYEYYDDITVHQLDEAEKFITLLPSSNVIKVSIHQTMGRSRVTLV